MTDTDALLSGIKVLEIATFVFGPGCGAILSDFGANVIKVESPGLGDPLRHSHKSPPFMKLDFAYPWQQDNRNKRSLALDLKTDEGREVLLKLVREADVLITNFPPHVLERLKIRYEDLFPENDQLIYGQITGYGEKGDDANTPGFDGNAYWARTGLMDAVRTRFGEPAMPAPAMGDHPSAMTMYAGIMTGLFKRERTGQGSKISTSLMANGLWAAASGLSGILAGTKPYRRLDPASPGSALVNYYGTADERWLSLIVIQDEKLWPGFLKAVERPDLNDDPRFANVAGRFKHAKELGAILSDIFKTRNCDEWRERLRDNKITFSVVATFEDVIDDAQALDNDMFIDVEGHNFGRGQAVNSPFWVSGSDKVSAHLGSELGADGPAILKELGYSESQIAAFTEQGVIESQG
ncbi:MAG: CoA transferase [Gammaproteobacteria bacterium]|nr:CoA transferase [Gammaproteobacteria bacterium]MBQ0840071.1 CoA transferase [Gammaproteobacteria bacterium]